MGFYLYHCPKIGSCVLKFLAVFFSLKLQLCGAVIQGLRNTEVISTWKCYNSCRGVIAALTFAALRDP